MQLVIMRHGQTDYNIDHRYAGVWDIPLNDTGRAQAKAAGVIQNVSLVYTSHLNRAQETASLCFPNAQQLVRPDLSEMDFGAFQGRTANEMENDAAYRAWVDAWCVPSCPQGESREHYIARVTRAVEEAVLEQRSANAKTTIIVAHGGTIMAAFFALACPAERRDFYEWHASNCGGFKADVVFGETDETSPNRIELCNIAEFSDLAFLAR